MDGDQTPEEQIEIAENDSTAHLDENVELISVFSYSLNHRIISGCVISAVLEPKGQQSVVAVSASNKVIIKDTETSLNITETIRCIASVPFGEGYDFIVIGTDSSIICYDVYNNLTVFRNDVPDGVNCFVYGKLGDLDEAIYCGGNCCIWGFDKTGANTYWTVTGDKVTTMCLSDYDADGDIELVIGSPDFEIRVFKNDLMRAELMETDEILYLTHIKPGCFSYALNNGTIGTYVMKERQWRIKSKANVSNIFNFEEQGLIVVVWELGKIDLRFAHNGEVLSRDNLPSAVASATLNIRGDEQLVTVVCVDGKVTGYKIQKAQNGAVDKTQQMIREFGQKKHNLMMELSNYEQEEQMTEAEKDRDFRIPADTSVNILFVVNAEQQILNLRVESSNNIPIRGVLIFAEGFFDGESYIWIPPNEHQSQCIIDIPLVVEKDNSSDLHTKVFLGHVDSNKLVVIENTRILPRFCRFTLLQPDHQKGFFMPTAYVQLAITSKNIKLSEWVRENFTLDASAADAFDEDGNCEFRFMGLRPKQEKSLMFQFNYKEKFIRIFHDNIETIGAIVQSYASHFQINNLDCLAHFPDVFKEAEAILEEIDPMTEVRDRLTAELQERQAAVKEIIIRAEDAVAIDNISEARKFYIRLKANDSAARQAAQLRWNNQERCVKSLRRLNKIIENCSRLRVGEPGRLIVTSCRSAIADDNKQIISKILQYGASN